MDGGEKEGEGGGKDVRKRGREVGRGKEIEREKERIEGKR